MFLGVAPSAFLTPISRVRSVTDTSMMFMMPIPPTSRLTAAIPDNRKGEDLRRLAERVQEVGLIADLEIVRDSHPQSVFLSEHPLNRGHRLRNLGLRCGQHADLPQPVAAEHPELRGRDRNQNLIVRDSRNPPPLPLLARTPIT